jgi:hypothetical protein
MDITLSFDLRLLAMDITLVFSKFSETNSRYHLRNTYYKNRYNKKT